MSELNDGHDIKAGYCGFIAISGRFAHNAAGEAEVEAI